MPANNSVPKPPEWIARRPAALERWERLWTEVDVSRVKGGPHGDLAAMYCSAYADWLDANDRLVSMGAVVKDQRNNVVPNPYVAVRDTAARQIAEIGKRLGLSPDAAREPVVSWEEYAAAIA